MESLSSFNSMISNTKKVYSIEEELETSVIRLDKNLGYMVSVMQERNRNSTILLSHIEKVEYYIGVILGLTYSSKVPINQFEQYLDKVNVTHNYESLIKRLSDIQTLWNNVEVNVRNRYREYFYSNYIALSFLAPRFDFYECKVLSESNSFR